MRFSERTGLDRRPNVLAVALEEARASGRPLLDLTASNPTRAGLAYDRSAILEALARPESLVYEPEPFGLPSAREAVAREIGAAPGRVVLTASTSEAYAFLFKLLCDPGDRVLVPQPSYPLLDMLARFEGIELVPYRLEYDGAWHVDLESLRAAAGGARAIVTVSPNNPTGSYLAREELEAFLATGLPVVSDEVFAPYPLTPGGPRRVSTVLQADRGLVFSLGGLSKLGGLPQMKLGWIAVAGEDALALEALGRLALIADAFLSVGTPIQHAAAGLLAASRVTRDAIRERTSANLETVRAALAGSAATLLRAEGGWYAVLELPRTRSEDEWTLALLQRDVIVQPGWLYDFPGEAYLVVSLLSPPEDLAAGLATLRALL